MLGRALESTVKSFIVVYRRIDAVIAQLTESIEKEFGGKVIKWELTEIAVKLTIITDNEETIEATTSTLDFPLSYVFYENCVNEIIKYVKQAKENHEVIRLRQIAEAERAEAERVKEEELTTLRELAEKYGYTLA